MSIIWELLDHYVLSDLVEVDMLRFLLSFLLLIFSQVLFVLMYARIWFDVFGLEIVSQLLWHLFKYLLSKLRSILEVSEWDELDDVSFSVLLVLL